MKTPALHALLVAGLLGLASGPAAAQSLNVGAAAPGTHLVSASAGADGAFVATLGYSHRFQVRDLAMWLGGDLTVPWAAPDFGDFRLRLNALAPVIGDGSWRLLVGLMPAVRGVDSPASRLTSLGLEAQVLAGYYGQRWFAAAELGGDWAALTYVQHTAHYRQTAYADARDGWYRSTGAGLHAGVQGGYSLGAFDLVLRAGQQRDLHLDTMMLPLYVTLGLNARLPL